MQGLSLKCVILHLPFNSWLWVMLTSWIQGCSPAPHPFRKILEINRNSNKTLFIPQYKKLLFNGIELDLVYLS